MRKRILGATAGGLALAGWAGPASAQAWIGQMAAEMGRQQSSFDCLGGKTLPASEVEEARTPGITLMRGFWARTVAARQTPEAASPLGTKWISGSAKTRVVNATFLADPVSPSSGLAMIDEPVGFARAGAQPNVTAYGLWRVVSASDPSRTVGYYRAEFLRFMFKWQLQSITALPAEYPPEVRPFCDKPGDIEQAKERQAERERRKAEKAARTSSAQ